MRVPALAALLPSESAQLPGVPGPHHAAVLFEAAHNRLSAHQGREFRRLLEQHRQGLEARPGTVEQTFGDQAGNVKLKLGLSDGAAVETVLLHDRPPGRGPARRTVCISSQVGCPIGCRFCRTGTRGLARSLTQQEIIGQYLAVVDRFGAVSNVVFMGMGEPLLNTEAVFGAASVLAHPRGPAIPFKRITISTCGIPAGIERLGSHHFLDEFPGARPRLAVSLVTADRGLRAELVPGTRLDAVRAAVARYLGVTGRPVTMEVTLLGGVNDSPAHAAGIAELIRGLPRADRVDVNLIPWNRVAGLPYRPPTTASVDAFAGELVSRGVAVTGRYPRGRSIAAACGQLGTTRSIKKRVAGTCVSRGPTGG